MKTRVALYGFGRLGRAVYHIAARRSDLDVVMVVTDESPEAVVDALMSDSIYATLEGEFEHAEAGFTHNAKHVHIRSVSAKDIWKEHNVDLVIDTSSKEDLVVVLAKHKAAGAKKVVFAAAGEGVTEIVIGANEDELKKVRLGVSGGGATLAAVLPVRAVLETAFGVEHMLAKTIDGTLCCGTAGACACGDECDCDDECSCHANGASVPAPLLVASVTEASFVLKHATTVAAVNSALNKAAAEPFYQGILAVADHSPRGDEVIGESVSALVSLSNTAVDGGRLVGITIWHDREWGYANRLVELAADFAKTGKAA